jgi:Domain of unknown function (DUF5107)
MLDLREFQEPLLTHQLTSAGPIPPVLDPDGVYPYSSFVETSNRPILRTYRFLRLENDALRVTICPDLGGKVYSLVEKKSGQETLFIPISIQPVRILPRFGFIPGGIEVSFPISHSPVQLEPVAWQSHRFGDRLYVWCGERELHSGMQWTVEYSLGEAEAFLTQRTCFQNPTRQAHSWMSWSNAAVPARPDTEFHFPNGPVLYHGAELKTLDWASQGPRTVAHLDRMTGFFWLKPDASAFGTFTPSLEIGLYHAADPASAPGMKLWSYGLGPHEIWGRAASLSGEGYVEIQGGPIRDQSIKETLQPAQTHSHVEFWIPSLTRLDPHSIQVPNPGLAPLSDVPWFDWPPRASVRPWLSVLAAHQRQTIADLPALPALDQDVWAPSGMDELGDALAWAGSVTSGEQRNGWLFQLGAWLAARGQVDQGLEALARSVDDRARALAGRLHLRAKGDAARALEAFRAIQSQALARHPQLIIERDLALAELGAAGLNERARWLDQVSNSRDEWLVERKAALLLDQGRPEEARALLASTPFQLVHQRYARTQLWNRVTGKQQNTKPAPLNWLGEDDLAQFGAYRQSEPSGQTAGNTRSFKGG